MIPPWTIAAVPLTFALGDRALFAATLRLQVRELALCHEPPPQVVAEPPGESLERSCDGFYLRSVPTPVRLPTLGRAGPYVRYVTSEYNRYYVDLRQPYTQYTSKFSAKSRSTLARKLRRFASHCGGQLDCREYKTPAELREFFPLARGVSARSYQQRLLDAGLPESAEYEQEAQQMAELGLVRAYLLFHDSQPVSYLYCPARGRALRYEYLGYDPQYATWSVGTLLQWLALERMFADGAFDLFDFTEGEAEHKRFFASGSIPSSNIMFLRKSVRNLAVVRAHRGAVILSSAIGDTLDGLGLKSRVRKLIRFGR